MEEKIEKNRSSVGDGVKNRNNHPRTGEDDVLNGDSPKLKSQNVSLFREYVIALRPWSFSASLTPVLLGATLSYKVTGYVNLLVLFAVCITTLSVHAAGNLVNTYYDFKGGVDNKKSDDKTLVEGVMSPSNVAALGGFCYAVGCAGLLILCFVSPAKVEHLALVYFCGLSGSFMYTGGLGLKYIALGDIVIFLTFGPLSVIFAYLAITGDFALVSLPYSIPLALNIECILHANNCRDRETDQKAGIVTLAIILGPTLSYLAFCILLFSPYIAFAYVAINYSSTFILPTVTIILAFSIERDFRSGNLLEIPFKVAKLNLILGISFVAALFLSHKNNLPFINWF